MSRWRRRLARPVFDRALGVPDADLRDAHRRAPA
jgi:hypothetical protein